MASHLFVIDVSPAIRRLVEEAAKAEGYKVMVFSDGPSALEEAERIRPEILIADYHLEGLTLTTFCDKLNNLDLIPGTQLVLLTNSSDRIDESGMQSRGVSAFLHKPLQSEQVRECIQGLREKQSRTAERGARPRRSWPPAVHSLGMEEAAVSEAALSETEDLEDSPIEVREPARKMGPKIKSPEVDSRTIAAAAAAAMAAHRQKAALPPVEAAWPKESPSPSERPPEPATPVAETPALPSPINVAEPAKPTVAPPPVEALRPKVPSSPSQRPPEPATPVAGTPAPPSTIKFRTPRNVSESVSDPPKATPSTPTPTRRPDPPPQPEQAATQPPRKPVQAPRQQSLPPIQAPRQPRPSVAPPVQSAAKHDLPPQVEQAVGDAFSALIRTLSEQSYAQNSQQLTEAVCREVTGQLTHLVQAEVSAQLAAAIPREHITKLVHEAVQQALPYLVTDHVSTIEQAVRQELSDKAAGVAEDTMDRVIREVALPVVEQQLPEIVRQQIGAVEEIAQGAAQEAAAQYAPQVAERVIREVAGELVRQIVPTIVPDIAEAQIKKEVERLTAPD